MYVNIYIFMLKYTIQTVHLYLVFWPLKSLLGLAVNLDAIDQIDPSCNYKHPRVYSIKLFR